MKFVILFFAFFGVSYALVPGMEYLYNYEGQVKIGMPEIRDRAAGAGIKGKILVQVQSWDSAVIQLQSVEVGEGKDDIDCEFRDPLHIDYKPLDGHSKLLEDPFRVYLRRDEGDVMETTKSEEVWISNVKRSIASLFLVVPIRENFGVEDSRRSPHLIDVRSNGHSTVKEPSIFGHCKSDYSMVPLNNTRRPETSRQGPDYPYPWTTYEMSRTINFDHCNVSVNTKQASMGNGSTSHFTQFGDVQSRHSVMRHNLTYDGQYYILQNGTNEGHLSVNPFGMNTEKIVSVSNQTYSLISTKRIDSNLQVPSPTRILDTWYAEISSDFKAGRHSPNWIRFEPKKDAKYRPLLEEQFWSGINLDDHQDKITNSLESTVDKMADIILSDEKPAPEHQIGPMDSDSAKLVSYLEYSLRAVRSLKEDPLQKLFDKYYKDRTQSGQTKLRLFIDSLGASGAGAAHKVFLDRINSTQISIHRAAAVFFSMPNNLISTPLVEDIGDYVKTLDLDRDPFATSVIFINYANAVNKLCVHHERRKYVSPYQVFGKDHCSSKGTVDNILPYFEQKLKAAKEEWKQIILIHAIGNIGSSRSFSMLKSIVENESYNSTVRVAAVYAISHKKLDQSFKRFALNTFMSVSENRTDDIFVRQACIVAVLSWRPPRSFYQTLASTSWMENSNEMSSFIYFILKSYADSSDPSITSQSQVARFFLPLSKPFAPSSRYSYTRLLSIYDTRSDLVTDYDVSSLRAGRYADSIPRQVFAFLINAFGGYRFSVAQSSLSYDGRDVHSLFNKMSNLLTKDWRNMGRSPSNRRTELAIEDIQKRMIVNSDYPPMSTYFFSLFDDMEVLLPLNIDSISKAFGHDGSKLLKELEYSTVNYTKFIDLGLLSLAVPSEIGLPLISRFSLPSFTGGPSTNLTLSCDGKRCESVKQVFRANEVRFNASMNYRFASKSLTMIKVLMPWNERVAMAATEALKAANIPANFTFTLRRNENGFRNFSVAIVPTTKDQVSVAQLHTVPFTCTKNMFPTDSLDTVQYKIISALGTGEGVENVHTPINESFTGIVGELRYEGDISYPFTKGNMIALASNPNLIPALFTSPTPRLHEASLVVDFGKSKTKEIHWSSAYKILPPSHRPVLTSELPEFEFKSTLLYNGTETRYFETHVKNAIQASGQRDKTTLDIELRRSKLPDYDNNAASYCFTLSGECPRIKNFDDLQKTFQSSENSEVDFNGDLSGGSEPNACQSKHIATLTGSLKISEQRRQNLSSELQSVCSYDPNDPTVTFTTAPVYDRLQLDISYKEPVPRVVKNATYHAYDLIRGFAFPHAYFNYMDQENNPKDKITIKGDRYLSEKRWKMEARSPTETSRFDYFKMPSFIENVVPVGGIEPSSQSFDSPKVLFESSILKECILTKDKVRMFDSLTFQYKVDGCESTVVTNTRAPEYMTAAVRREDNDVAFVIRFTQDQTTLVVKPGLLTANDKDIALTNKPTEIKSPNGKVIATASKQREYTNVEVPRLFHAVVSRKEGENQISILPNPGLRGSLAGLCGRDNGEKKMIGPKGCIYSDPQLFTYSWMQPNGKECDKAHYDEAEKQVAEYQKNCPKVNENTLRKTAVLSKFSKVPPDCIEFVYKIRRHDDNLCVTQDIVAICYPLCKMDKPVFFNEIYSCWPEASAPEELKRNEKRGYIRHKIDLRGIVDLALKTEHAFICSRK